MIDKFDYQSALEDCKAVRDSIKSDEDFQNADSGLVLYYLNTIVSALEIAVNAKHGKWVECETGVLINGIPEKSDMMMCSNCNGVGVHKRNVHVCKFCPFCGAKMFD